MTPVQLKGAGFKRDAWGSEASVTSSKQTLQIFLGLGGFRIIKGCQGVRVSQDNLLA